MTQKKIYNIVIDTVIEKLSSCSSMCIGACFSFVTLVLSILFVYALSQIFHDQYNIYYFVYSVTLPLLLTPVVVVIVIRLTKHLKSTKQYLSQEIEQSKKKDIMLFEQARFVLMGEMMANISHQWKQPLNTINLAILTAKTTKADKDNLEKYFDIMEDNVTYLATTIDDFMSFFDKKTNLEIRDLPSIVKEIKSIIETHIKNKYINLEIYIESNNGEVLIASSISQVILNLLNNAKDAFDENAEDKTIILKLTSLYDGLRIECCDNGRGIEPDIIEKIFDPYFTTKQKQQGTGIGLYMSKQIIQKIFNGTIEVSSSCSLGDKCKDKTCFSIMLPYSKNCILKKEGE